MSPDDRGAHQPQDVATDHIKTKLSPLTLGGTVRYSTQIRPISYLKANAADVLRELEERRKPMIITQNGEAKAVLQDVASYEETQETLALLKMLALGSPQVERGEIKPIREVASRLRCSNATTA
jgi:prevent-host-death family protein